MGMSAGELTTVIAAITVAVTSIISALASAYNSVKLNRVSEDVKRTELNTNSMSVALVKAEKLLSYQSGIDHEKQDVKDKQDATKILAEK